MIAPRLLIALGLCPLLSTGAQRSPRTIWNEMEPAARMWYVRGLVDGFELGRLAAVGVYKLDSSRLRPKPTKRDAEKFDSTVKTVFGNFTVSGDRFSAVVDLMTTLYSDPANTCVLWPSMFSIAADQLAGAQAKDVAASLEEQRRLSKSCGGSEPSRSRLNAPAT